MALLASAALFAVFIGNVALGAIAGRVLLSDVTEMVILLMASIAFVIAILQRETAAVTAAHPAADGKSRAGTED